MKEPRYVLCFPRSPDLIPVSGLPEVHTCDRHWWFSWMFTLVFFVGAAVVAVTMLGDDPGTGGYRWLKMLLILCSAPWIIIGFLRSLRERRRLQRERAKAGRCPGAESITPVRDSRDSYNRRE